MTIFSFGLFLLMFLVVGLLSALKNKHTSTDYLVASHNIQPWMAALSAVATNNSGYMFIGMIGYTYSVGFSSIWLMVGWITGDLVASLLIHKKLRIKSEEIHAVSYGELLANWFPPTFKYLRILCGLITFVFLGAYAAAQLKAGSKALFVLFNWDYSVGAMIGTVIMLSYCFAGGIRASIWTDVAQSVIMIAAMALLLVTAVMHLGGIDATLMQIDSISPSYTQFFPQNLYLGTIAGPVMFVIGWFFAGLGVAGQPHIMIRFMALSHSNQMSKMRVYYYSWYTAFFALTIGVGLVARLLIPDVGNFDPELALPLIAVKLFHPFFVGLVLAGLFAATMSTADSQILSCTSAISHDLKLNKRNSYWVNKLITVIVALIALYIALYAHESVFSLVLITWSALGSAFVPLLMVLILKGKPNQVVSISMILTGLSTMIIWRLLGLNEQVYEIMPGILMGFLPYFLFYKQKIKEL